MEAISLCLRLVPQNASPPASRVSFCCGQWRTSGRRPKVRIAVHLYSCSPAGFTLCPTPTPTPCPPDPLSAYAYGYKTSTRAAIQPAICYVLLVYCIVRTCSCKQCPGVFLFDCERADDLHKTLTTIGHYSWLGHPFDSSASAPVAERNGICCAPATPAAACGQAPNRRAAPTAGVVQATRVGDVHVLSNPAAFEDSAGGPLPVPVPGVGVSAAFHNFPSTAPNLVRLRRNQPPPPQQSGEENEELDHIYISTVLPHIADAPNLNSNSSSNRSLTNGAAAASNTQNASASATERM